MKRQWRSKKLLQSICFVLCLCLFATILLSSTSNWMVHSRKEAPFRELDITLTRFEEREEDGARLKDYTVQLPEIPESGETVYLYVVHQYAQLSLDGETLASCREPETKHLGRSPGCYWLSSPLSKADSGKTLCISLQTIYPSLRDREPIVSLSSPALFGRALLRQSAFELILSLTCVLFGMICILSGIGFSAEHRGRRQILSLGSFTGAVGIWKLCDMRITAFLLPEYSQLLYFISVLSLFLAPVFFLSLLYLRTEKKRDALYGCAIVFFLLEAVVFVLLQLIGAVDLRRLVGVNLISVSVVCLPICIKGVYKIVKKKCTGVNLLYEIFYLALALSSTLDVLRYILLKNSRYLPVFLCVTVLYAATTCYMIVKQAFERRRRAAEMERELSEARDRIMLSQIQPHFLFNSLSVIRELCHSDPGLAEEATVMFSRFLRQNMSSLLSDENVSFSEELEHTKNYLAIEKLRFGTTLRVEYDIQATEFCMPTLTLQPIAENAVRHGVSKKIGGGTVRISSRETDDGFEIVVFNDGAPFEPGKAADDGREHVGIQNVRRRLQTVDGTLEIHSEGENGTWVTIRIPQKRTQRP